MERLTEYKGLLTGMVAVTGLATLYFTTYGEKNAAAELKGYESSSLKLMLDGWKVYRKHKKRQHQVISDLYSQTPPVLEGKTIVLTGSTSGLGRGMALHFLALGATLILPVRRTLPADFKQKLVEESALLVNKFSRLTSPKVPTIDTCLSKITLIRMDLSDLESVSAAASEIKALTSSIFALVNNAGLVNPHGKKSAQGIEMTLAVNAVGSALFTELLLEKKALDKNANVVSVTSEEHRHSAPLDLSIPLIDQPILKNLAIKSVMERYSFSKLVQSSYFHALMERTPSFRVLDICPGAVASNIAGKFEGPLYLVGVATKQIMALGLFGFLQPVEASLPIVQFICGNSASGHALRGERVEAREDVLDKHTQDWVCSEISKIGKSFI